MLPNQRGVVIVHLKLQLTVDAFLGRFGKVLFRDGNITFYLLDLLCVTETQLRIFEPLADRNILQWDRGEKNWLLALTAAAVLTAV